MQIKCDAPKCDQVKASTNGWWIQRKTEDGSLLIEPIHDRVERPDDQHLCSSRCVHDITEAWIQSHTDKEIVLEAK